VPCHAGDLLLLMVDNDFHHSLEDGPWRFGDSGAPFGNVRLGASQDRSRGLIASEDLHEKLNQSRLNWHYASFSSSQNLPPARLR
jgi:hypothetical protein